ncbi:MAG: hypothetical protein WCQ47_00820 [bacterium]
MKNVIQIFILLSLITFSTNVFAKNSTKKTDEKFLRAKKHFKVVAKETQKLEKALAEPGVEKVIEQPVTPVEEPIKEIADETPKEPIKSEPIEAQTVPEETKIMEETIKAETTPAPTEESISEWLYMLKVDGNIDMIKVYDKFGRDLKLISNVGFGGDIEIGYRFGEYFALIANYSIDRIKFSDFSAYTVTQDISYLMSGRVGPRFYLGKKLSLDILAGLRQNYTVYAVSISNIAVDRFNHGSITVAFNYSIIDSERFIMTGKTEIDAFLPVTKTAWNTSLGLGAKTELNMGVPVGLNSFVYFNIGAGYINLKQNISSQYGIAGFGGLGFCRRT